MSLLVQALFFPSRQLQRGVIIGNMRRTAKHQMLEQMGKTGVFRMLIARTDIIDDVQRHHLRTGILVMHQTQAIGETMFVYFSYAVDEDVAKVHHSITVTFVIFTSSSGRSLRSVFTCCILSTTSMPSSTSPNTVYSPSKCGVPPTVV